MKVDQKLVNQCADDTFGVFAKFMQPTHVDKFRARYENSSKNILPENIGYCLAKFLQAEFDYDTRGNRGLGRLTEHCPRLAAYFRKQISGMSAEKSEQLDSLLTALIVKSYLFPIITADEPKPEPAVKEPDKLYENWIPKIYTYELGSLDDTMGSLLFAVVEPDLAGIKVFFKENDMGKKFWGEDKTDEILYGYIAAGMVLRFSEG